VSSLEIVTRTAPYGIRPWDAVSGRAVTDGLRLTELRSGVAATPNRSGVLVFHDLPGLRDSATGRGDDASRAAPPAGSTFHFELVDRDRRFLAMRFAAIAPARVMRALDPAPGASSVVDVATMQLHSAPSRRLPHGTAAIRADLWDVERDAPAAYAVLEVRPPGGPAARGIADEQGRVLVALAYPEAQLSGSTPQPASRRLADQTWALTLAVRYDGHAAGRPGVVPDLDEVLDQAAGRLLEHPVPLTPLTGATLAFGRELTLRSGSRSVVLVSPGPGEPHV
jgi:hypothetical protein